MHHQGVRQRQRKIASRIDSVLDPFMIFGVDAGIIPIRISSNSGSGAGSFGTGCAARELFFINFLAAFLFLSPILLTS